MKKLLFSVIFTTFLMSTTIFADTKEVGNKEILVDGENVTFTNVININGQNYYKKDEIINNLNTQNLKAESQKYEGKEYYSIQDIANKNDYIILYDSKTKQTSIFLSNDVIELYNEAMYNTFTNESLSATYDMKINYSEEIYRTETLFSSYINSKYDGKNFSVKLMDTENYFSIRLPYYDEEYDYNYDGNSSRYDSFDEKYIKDNVIYSKDGYSEEQCSISNENILDVFYTYMPIITNDDIINSSYEVVDGKVYLTMETDSTTGGAFDGNISIGKSDVADINIIIKVVIDNELTINNLEGVVNYKYNTEKMAEKFLTLEGTERYKFLYDLYIYDDEEVDDETVISEINRQYKDVKYECKTSVYFNKDDNFKILFPNDLDKYEKFEGVDALEDIGFYKNE